jgi:hypothetical protein
MYQVFITNSARLAQFLARHPALVAQLVLAPSYSPFLWLRIVITYIMAETHFLMRVFVFLVAWALLVRLPTSLLTQCLHIDAS